MTECPYCKMIIDPDSFYCDQCGGQIYICPSCHVFGKGEGKHCGLCGKKLIPAQSLHDNSQHSTDRSPVEPIFKPDTSSAFVSQDSSTITTVSPSVLKCRSENIVLHLSDNAIIGRTNGDYVTELSGLIYISGTHAQLHCTGANWTITDLNSRNGTKVNNIKCQPTLSFKIGDTIKIANTYDFIVE